MGWTSESARDCAGFDSLPLLVDSCGALEVKLGGGCFALGGEGREHGLAAGVEETLYSGGFGFVGRGAGRRAGLVARREALVHLLVDAAGMLGIRGEIFVAAAELEEVEDGVAVAVGGGARWERAVEVVEGALAEAVGGVDARVGVLGGEAEEERRAQAKATAGFVEAEDCGRRVVEGEGRLELRAGDGVVDAGDAVRRLRRFFASPVARGCE